MKIAFQMEPMAETDPASNNSLVMIEEACRRGHAAYHYRPEDITLDNAGLSAPAAPVSVDLAGAPFYSLGEYARADLSGFDMIVFRQDPPFDMGYVTNTHMLDMLARRGVHVVNDPFWIRNMPDKLSVFDYPDFLPPTLISRDEARVREFFAVHGDVVVKPLYGFHGHGVVRTGDANAALAALQARPEPLILQPFLKEIMDGNKRIVFFDGEFAGAIKNVPRNEDEFLVLRTSTDVAYDLNAREQALCARLGPVLKQRGLIFVGVDLIGDYLTEINAGSVGTLRRMNAVYGGRHEAKLWDAIERRFA